MVARGQLQGVSNIKVLDKLTYAGVKSNLDSASSLSRYEFVQGDICNPAIITELIQDVDAVINFAAESHVDRSIDNPSIFIETNVLGTYTVLEVAKRNKVGRVIQISTDEVYGSIENGSWDENSPLQPNSPYSASKASGDLLARSYVNTYGMDVIVTRCCNNYGPYQHPEKLIPLLINKILHGEDLPIYGDGKNIREWIHVSDHARAIAFLAIEGIAGQIYNIGTPDEFENIEVANLLLKASNLQNSKLTLVEDRKGHDFRYSLNAEKLKKMGFDIEKSLQYQLVETVAWYRDRI